MDERPKCRKVIEKILERDKITLEDLNQKNLSYGLRMQLRKMIKEDKNV